MRDLTKVESKLREAVEVILKVMEKGGLPMLVTDTLRTTEEQQALYAQGRTKPGQIVTYADGIKVKSNHQAPEGSTLGRAVDMCFLINGKPAWPNDSKLWNIYGAVAKAHGLVWGGDWKDSKGKPRPDYPHIELPKDFHV